LHQILIEHDYQEIRLLFTPEDESAGPPAARRAYLGEPVHAWSLADAAQPEFLANAHAILRPHIERLRLNRQLREFDFLRLLKWETGRPPEEHSIMMTGRLEWSGQEALNRMVPSIQRLLAVLPITKSYRDFPALMAMVEMMRRYEVEPDDDNTLMRSAALKAQGPDLSDVDVIRIRHMAGFDSLNLSGLQLREDALTTIPEDITGLVMIETSITDAGIAHLLRLTRLARLNLSDTAVTDPGLNQLAALAELRWLNVERTHVTQAGIDRLKSSLPNLEIVH
jgi:hypothetical protein